MLNIFLGANNEGFVNHSYVLGASIITLLVTAILDIGSIVPSVEIHKLSQRGDVTCPGSPHWEATELSLDPWSPYS